MAPCAELDEFGDQDALDLLLPICNDLHKSGMHGNADAKLSNAGVLVNARADRALPAINLFGNAESPKNC